MKSIQINTNSRSYAIEIGDGLRSQIGFKIRNAFPDCDSVMLISDDAVAPLWGADALNSLADASLSVHKHVFINGESSKTLATLSLILEHMESCGLNRSSIVIALGGGVVGDMAGLAAALYMRGIRYIQMPTTLLAAQDSSVGGKTAVNMSAKNTVGAFWQPSLVICDCEMLCTLSEDTFADGMAEMIKHGILADPVLLDMIRNKEQLCNLAECIYRSILVKASVVSEDELDTGRRQLLNLGHTIGHAIEHCSDYRVTHGSAVAAGICMMARACERQGLAAVGTSAEIESLYSACGLPITSTIETKALYSAAQLDKKRGNRDINLIRIRALSDCYISREPMESLREIIDAGR